MGFEGNQIREGMTVYSADGEKLGKVLTCEERSFIVEKGFFFPKDYVARYDDVAEVTGDDIRLYSGLEALRQVDEYTAAIGAEPALGTSAAGPTIGAEPRSEPTRASDEIRMPVVEEEIEAVKRDREAGEVRLKKEVVTEHRHLDVPVTREDVRVERVAAPEREAGPADASFEEKSVSMPVREEEIEIRKRPVVKEEVRLRKERVTEQRAADAEVRKERVDVEGDPPSRMQRDPMGPVRDDPDKFEP